MKNLEEEKLAKLDSINSPTNLKQHRNSRSINNRENNKSSSASNIRNLFKKLEFPHDYYDLFIITSVVVVSSATTMFGYSAGCLLNLSLICFSPLTFNELTPLVFILIFITSLFSYLYGLKNHLDDASMDQMFINYDFIRIIVPILLIGIKLGLLISIVISNHFLVIASLIVALYTTIMAFKR